MLWYFRVFFQNVPVMVVSVNSIKMKTSFNWLKYQQTYRILIKPALRKTGVRLCENKKFSALYLKGVEYLVFVSSHSLKTRELSLSQFVYFSLVLREREETKTKYSAPFTCKVENFLFLHRRMPVFRRACLIRIPFVC